MSARRAAALALLLAGLGVVVAAWRAIDRGPPEWDHANHLERAILCQRSLRVPFSLRADGVRYGGVRLPSLLVGWVVRNFDPTPRLRRLPMTVSVAPISIEAGRLDVGSDPGPRCPTKESH